MVVPKNKTTSHGRGKSGKFNSVNGAKNSHREELEDDEDVPGIEELYSSSDEEETDSGSDEDEDEEEESSSNEVEDSGEDYDTADEEEDSIPEDQGGSSSDEDELERQMRNREEESDDEQEEVDGEEGSKSNYDYDLTPRSWGNNIASVKHNRVGSVKDRPEGPRQVMNDKAVAMHLHTDDFSSDDDDEDGTGNRIGRIPLHWYEEYDHIGYDLHGNKVMKQTSGAGGEDLLDRALKNDDAALAATVYDALNDKEVTLSQRQIDLIRRIQAGAFAHPEFDANPDYVDYYSGVDTFISGIGSDRYEPKHRFQPSKWEKLMVRRLLHRLKTGKITMDYLTGKDPKNLKGSNKEEEQLKKGYFLLWKGDEEDEIALRRGPMHLPAPKVAPPGHAESYNPSEEYLPTPEELKQWEQMDVKDRPYGLLIPQKFTSLRAVGAYEHSVRESFERCLDLYLCPRVMKRRLNIDPETLIPSLPKPSDLRPFPTALCVTYETPHEEDKSPIIRCLSVSPDGQFLVSGASDGFVRLWEVQSGRLLRSWDISSITEEYNNKLKTQEGKTEGDDNDDEEMNKQLEVNNVTNTNRRNILPVVAVEWNPNKSHHCLLAAVGSCAVLIATGTGGVEDAELTDALLSAAASANGDNVKSAKAAQAVKWFAVTRKKPKKDSSQKLRNGDLTMHSISALGGSFFGPICILKVNKDISNLKWHRRGDYFLTVAPKAGAASVLIHQLSKANSQQPFSKSKGGETQCACFHPNKPFLFVATQQQVRVYHLIKQEMVKKLISGCRWLSSLDVHPSGDHLLVGSLDRRVAWFDLDLSSTPYKTLKYHEKAVRSASFHYRYPLFATSSDDGTVHVFHGMVYSDLMRNPLLVPCKVLRGHTVTNKFGVLASVFHPTQPWLFSAGADGKIILFQDI